MHRFVAVWNWQVWGPREGSSELFCMARMMVEDPHRSGRALPSVSGLLDSIRRPHPARRAVPLCRLQELSSERKGPPFRGRKGIDATPARIYSRGQAPGTEGRAATFAESSAIPRLFHLSLSIIRTSRNSNSIPSKLCGKNATGSGNFRSGIRASIILSASRLLDQNR